LEKVTKGNVTARLKEIKFDPEGGYEADALDAWLKLCNDEAAAKKAIKDAEAALDGKALAKYPTLSKDEVKTLVVDDKWLAGIAATIHGEMDRISQTPDRVKTLAERYETPLPQGVSQVPELERKITHHLEEMGFTL
jgi:type I restriction enzyme M protein